MSRCVRGVSDGGGTRLARGQGNRRVAGGQWDCTGILTQRTEFAEVGPRTEKREQRQGEERIGELVDERNMQNGSMGITGASIHLQGTVEFRG